MAFNHKRAATATAIFMVGVAAIIGEMMLVVTNPGLALIVLAVGIFGSFYWAIGKE